MASAEQQLAAATMIHCVRTRERMRKSTSPQFEKRNTTTKTNNGQVLPTRHSSESQWTFRPGLESHWTVPHVIQLERCTTAGGRPTHFLLPCAGIPGNVTGHSTLDWNAIELFHRHRWKITKPLQTYYSTWSNFSMEVRGLGSMGALIGSSGTGSKVLMLLAQKHVRNKHIWENTLVETNQFQHHFLLNGKWGGTLRTSIWNNQGGLGVIYKSMSASQSNNVFFMIRLMLYITLGHYLTWLKTHVAWFGSQIWPQPNTAAFPRVLPAVPLPLRLDNGLDTVDCGTHRTHGWACWWEPELAVPGLLCRT